MVPPEAVLERVMSILSPILPDDAEIALAPRGFLRGTRLLTPRGLRLVEELRPGDVVMCCKGDPVVLRSVARTMVPIGWFCVVLVSLIGCAPTRLWTA